MTTPWRALWREPRPAGAPPVGRGDWLLVAAFEVAALAEGLELWFRAKAPKEFSEAFAAILEEATLVLSAGLIQDPAGHHLIDLIVFHQ